MLPSQRVNSEGVVAMRLPLWRGPANDPNSGRNYTPSGRPCHTDHGKTIVISVHEECGQQGSRLVASQCLTSEETNCICHPVASGGHPLLRAQTPAEGAQTETLPYLQPSSLHPTIRVHACSDSLLFPSRKSKAGELTNAESQDSLGRRQPAPSTAAPVSSPRSTPAPPSASCRSRYS
jgi:hypothetical protein